MHIRTLLLAQVIAIAALVGGCTQTTPAAPSPGPFRFSGLIAARGDTKLGDPIAGARLTVVDGANLAATTVSDGAGRYSMDGLEQGRFSLSISAPGFVSVSPVVELYRDTEVNFALLPK